MNTIRSLKGDSGAAALITLLLIGVLSTLAVWAVQNSMTEVDTSFNDVQYGQAFELADAGLDRALAELDADAAWRTGFANENLGNAKLSLVVLDSSSGVSSGDTIVLRSTVATNVASAASVILERWLIPATAGDSKYVMVGWREL